MSDNETHTDNAEVAAIAAAMRIASHPAGATAEQKLKTFLTAYKAIMAASALAARQRTHEIDPGKFAKGEVPDVTAKK